MVMYALFNAWGGEIYVPKIPSMKIIDLARAVAPECKIKYIGIRPGEKLHELMITEDDARRTLEFDRYYVIQPEFSWWKKNNNNKGGRKVPDDFKYSSNNNEWWLTKKELIEMVNVGDKPSFYKLSKVR